MPTETRTDALEQVYQIAAACIAINNGASIIEALLEKVPDADVVELLDRIVSANASTEKAIRQLADRMRHPNLSDLVLP